MRNLMLTLVLPFFIGMQPVLASVQTDIETANKAGKVVFLVVTEPGNSDNAAALNLGQESQKLYPKSTVIEMNRADRANESLVGKYGLAGAPLPLLLVIASNGAVAGGAVYNQTTSQNLVALIPSPRKADVLKAINEGKSVFIVVSKKESVRKKEVLSKCEVACAEMKGNAKIVEIDFDDAVEKKFLTDLKITEMGDTTRTYVINSKGQIAGSFTGITESQTLVATATKKPAGCCAPGSGKSCGPAKKPN